LIPQSIINVIFIEAQIAPFLVNGMDEGFERVRINPKSLILKEAI
jgi:hypothetical protein